MLKLCFKDYLAGRWLWLLILVLYLVFAAQAASFRMSLMLFASPALALAWIIASEILDDKDKAAALYLSLPLTRSDIVRGRYLLAAGLTLAAAAAVFGVIGTARAFPGGRPGDAVWPWLFTAEGFAGFVLVTAVLLALYLPLTFRFGPYRAGVLYPAALAAAAGALFALERLATRVLPLFRPVFTSALARDPAAGIADLLARARGALGGPALVVAALAFAALAAAMSLACSLRFYDRREF